MTAPKPSDPDWITAQTASRILGVGWSTLQRLVEDGTVDRAARPSHRYSRTQIEAVAADRTEWTTSSQAARILGVSRVRLDQLARAGRIPYETDDRGNRRYRRNQIQVVANARNVRWHTTGL